MHHILQNAFALVLAAALCVPGIASAQEEASITGTATLLDKDVYAEGSLVTFTLRSTDPIPPIGARGRLIVQMSTEEVQGLLAEELPGFLGTLLRGATAEVELNLNVSAGTVEVVSVSERTVTVKIVEVALKNNEVFDMLPESGGTMAFEWQPPTAK